MKTFAKVVFLGWVLFLPSCLGWFLEKPTFSLKELAVTRISTTDIHFLFGIEVQNPNSFDLKLRGLEYTVYLNEQEVGKGRLEKETLIAKSSSSVVQVPLQANFRSLGNPLGIVLSGQDLKYKIEGVAIIQASMGSATIPFSKSGEVRIKK